MEDSTQKTMSDTQAETPADKPIVFLDFWAEWCGPCKIMSPIIHELKEEYKDTITIKEIDVDAPENQELVEKYQIMSIPTYIVLKNGEVAEHFVGAQPKEAIVKRLANVLAEDKTS